MTKSFSLNLQTNWPKYGRSLAVGLALAVFLPSLAAWFSGEDFTFILPASTGRPFYEAWQNLFYRPLPNLLWQLDYTLWGLNAPGYHLTNLIIHAANAGLVGWLVKKHLRSDLAGLVGALLFALTPVHTEPVVWLAGRPDLLATFFGLLTLVMAAHFSETGKGWLYAAGLAAFGAAIFSKESVAGLPFFLVGADLLVKGWPRSAQSWRNFLLKYAPFFLVEVIYWLVRFAVLGSLGSYGNGGWLNIAWNLTVGLWQPLLFPFNYESTGWLWGGLLSALLLVFYGWLVLPLLKRPRFKFSAGLKTLGLPLLLLYTGMAPALTQVPTGLDLSQARLLYLPSAGFCWLLDLGIRARLAPENKASGEIKPVSAQLGPVAPALKPGFILTLLALAVIYIAGLTLALSPWLEAGAAAKATFDRLQQAGLPFRPGDYIYYEGLPDSYQGAYIWRNGLDEASTLLLGPGIGGTRRLPDQLIDYGKAVQGRLWFVRYGPSPDKNSPAYLFSYSLSGEQNSAPGQSTGGQTWDFDSCQAGGWQFTPSQGGLICQAGQGLYLQTGWQKTSLTLASPALRTPASATGLEIIFSNYVDFDFQQPQIFSDLSLAFPAQSSLFQQPFELAGDGKPHRYHFYLPLASLPANQGDLRLAFAFNKFRSNILWKDLEIRFTGGQ